MNNATALPLRSFILWSVCIVLLLSGLAGCATTEEHQLLSARVKALEDDRARMQAKMAEDVKRLQELNETIKRSEATLRKSGANLGLRVSHLEQALPKASGRMEVTEHLLKSLKHNFNKIRDLLVRELDAVALLIPKDLPADADGIWQVAQSRYKAGEMRIARAILRDFEASFPKDKRAIKARLLRAKILEDQGDKTKAIATYRRIEKLYPGAVEIPSAILRMGELCVAIGDCKRAKNVYRYLALGKYKDTPEAETAKVRFEELNETCAK